MLKATEAPNSTDSGNFHVFSWKLPLTSMEVGLLLLTSMEIYNVVFCRVRTEPYPGYLTWVLHYKELLQVL